MNIIKAKEGDIIILDCKVNADITNIQISASLYKKYTNIKFPFIIEKIDPLVGRFTISIDTSTYNLIEDDYHCDILYQTNDNRSSTDSFIISIDKSITYSQSIVY